MTSPASSSTTPSEPPSIGAEAASASYLRVRLRQTRDQLVERLYIAAGLFAILYLPVLAWRVHDLGWLHPMRLQAAVAALTLAAFALRKRLPLAFKSALAVTVVTGLGLAGVATTGMTGPGYWWFLQAAVLTATLYSFRAGFAMAIAVVPVMLLVAWGFVAGVLNSPFDLNEHQHSASGWVGFLVVVSFAPLLLLVAFSSYLQTIKQLVTELHTQREELARKVGHDSLTGLPQATLAADRLETALRQAARRGGAMAVLFIDLDGFKAVNDEYGHAVGDELLRQVAALLRASVRAQDTVARVGGDEFIVILHECDDAAAACRSAEQIIARVRAAALASQPQQQQLAQAGASIGIALYPEHGSDAASLRNAADAAMYRSKRRGRNGWQLAAAPGSAPGASPNSRAMRLRRLGATAAAAPAQAESKSGP